MATAEPLTPPWLAEYRDRIDPLLTPIQRAASKAIWAWFDHLWEREQVLTARLKDLQGEVLPILERIEQATDVDRDEVIADLIVRLEAIDTSVFFPG